MKVLFCGICGDIRAFSTTHTPCKCGNMSARWADPNTGTYRVRAKVKQRARIIGMNNSFLHGSLNLGRETPPNTSEKWRLMHESACDAPGYIFDKSIRNCWACIIKPGDTNDGTWEEDSTPYRETVERDGYTAYIEEDLNHPSDDQIFKVEVFDSDWKKLHERGGYYTVIAAQTVVQRAIDEHMLSSTKVSSGTSSSESSSAPQ
jgi:hypothetical protein